MIVIFYIIWNISILNVEYTNSIVFSVAITGDAYFPYRWVLDNGPRKWLYLCTCKESSVWYVCLNIASVCIYCKMDLHSQQLTIELTQSRFPVRDPEDLHLGFIPSLIVYDMHVLTGIAMSPY